MGKDKIRGTLIRLIANLVVHKIVMKNTNKPESRNFLMAEIVEYRSQSEKTAESYNWNNEDKEHIEKEALRKIKEKLSFKYSDVKYSEKEAIEALKEIMNELV